MKRIVVILFLISYSIASFGVSLNYFYCCGKLKTVSFAVNTAPNNGETKSKKGCCDHRTVIYKLKTDQKNTESASYDFNAPLSVFTVHQFNYHGADLFPAQNVTPLYKRPPPFELPSRKILYCIFRI